MPDNNATNHSVRYEKTDAGLRGIVLFGVGLGILGLVTGLVSLVVFNVLTQRERESDTPLAPLAAVKRPRLPENLDKIPQPRLQKEETPDLAKLRQREEKLLHPEGSDKASVRISIEEAMTILADPKQAAKHGIRVRSMKGGGQ